MNRKILVIDDERGPRESMRILLKNKYDIFLADNVDEGLKILKRESPDVVVLDIRMPDKNGIEGLREIRAIDADVSVIILTGFAELETAQSAIRHGANEYMKKPFDAGDMMATIARHVELTDINRRRNHAFQKIEKLDGQIEEMVGAKDQMASMGLASSALMHDLRNPLMVIHAYIEMLSEALKGMDESLNGDIRSYMENIEKNIDRCNKLANDWNLLGKPDAIKFKKLSLNKMLEETVNDIRLMGKERGVRIITRELPPDLWLEGEISLLERAFWNIAKNAVDAAEMESDGKVEVLAAREGGNVKVRFTDNGPGIPPDEIEQIFEPLKSGKPIGAGFGLGLFITKEVVEQHNGEIAFESGSGSGTTVTVTLPETCAPD